MPDDPSIRASDADRDAVARRLQDAHAEGRITADELTERLSVVYSARTLGELEPVTADLPVLPRPVARTEPAAPREQSAAQPPARRDDRSSIRAQWGAWAAASLVCTVIWVLSLVGAHGWVYPWPVWVAGPWGAVLLARTLFGDRSA